VNIAILALMITDQLLFTQWCCGEMQCVKSVELVTCLYHITNVAHLAVGHFASLDPLFITHFCMRSGLSVVWMKLSGSISMPCTLEVYVTKELCDINLQFYAVLNRPMAQKMNGRR